MRPLTVGWLLFAAVLGVLQAICYRTSMNPDGIAYLDMGDAYWRGDWGTAIRSHWSPLYAWILGAALRVAQPTPAAEFPLVHLVNLLIYGVALGAFTFLLTQVAAAARAPTWAVISVGFATFVWCVLQYTPLGLVTPDLLVSALVYAICAVILRLRRAATWRGSAVLGALLGLGYLAKAPMLPLAVVFLAASAALLQDGTRRVAHLSVAAGALVAVALPFAVALSLANGRPTVSDSAVLNYLWRIDGEPFVHWQGGLHHSVLLQQSPAIYSFDSPFRVTYSPWYAPEYWFAGATPAFVWSSQLQAFGDALVVYGRLIADLWVPLAGLAVVAVFTRRLNGASLALLAPATAAFIMYAAVLVEERYVAPFLVLTVLGLLSMVRLPRVLGGVLVMALLVQIGGAAAELVEPGLSQVMQGQLVAPDEQARVAEALHSAGVQSGDAIVSGNRGFNAYWARLARVRIVAEVSGYDGTAILESDPDARTAAERVLLAQPVRAVVAYGWPALTGDERWRPIEGTAYSYAIT